MAQAKWLGKKIKPMCSPKLQLRMTKICCSLESQKFQSSFRSHVCTKPQKDFEFKKFLFPFLYLDILQRFLPALSKRLTTKFVESRNLSTQFTKHVSVLESNRVLGLSMHFSQHISVKLCTRAWNLAFSPSACRSCWTCGSSFADDIAAKKMYPFESEKRAEEAVAERPGLRANRRGAGNHWVRKI